MSRRLLLISYHFGPRCDTGGLRWNAFTVYLAQSGWEVDVVSAARPGVDLPYEWLPGVRVTPVAVPTWLGVLVAAGSRVRRKLIRLMGATPRRSGEELQAVASISGERPGTSLALRQRLYSQITSNIYAGVRWGTQVGWARRAVAAGIEVARQRAPDVVAVSSPPHATHLAGVRLARELAIPFLADLRDPWIFGEPDDIQSATVDRRLGALAQERVFGAASKIILNTRWAEQAVREHDARLRERVATVPNGYDPRSGIGRPDTELFRVAYVGWLYHFMNPEPILAACGRLRDREGLQSLRIEFVGTDPAPNGVSLVSLAQAHGVEPYFEHRHRVSREEALQAQERAAVQVVFDYPGPLRVPMKFYDGVQMYGDLLLIGRRQSALADAAAQVGLAVCPPDDSAAIDAVLLRALARWRARDYSVSIDATGVFARERTSGQMLRHLEDLLEPSASKDAPKLGRG